MKKLEFLHVILRCTAATVFARSIQGQAGNKLKLLANRAISRTEKAVDTGAILGQPPRSKDLKFSSRGKMTKEVA
jgi:hypothetical protein